MNKRQLIGYKVHLNGRPTTAILTGLCRKPIFVRARKGDVPFFVLLLSDEWGISPVAVCWAHIRRTKRVARELHGDHLLRGIPSVERVLQAKKFRNRRGRVWSIRPVYAVASMDPASQNEP